MPDAILWWMSTPAHDRPETPRQVADLTTGGSGRPRCSVVVPAHDEAAVITERLRLLTADLAPGEVEIVVVANGCTDDTAALARRVPGVQVVELDLASKTAALNAGDLATRAVPRIYLDADIELPTRSLRVLAEALGTDRPVVAAPRVSFDVSRSSWAVRAFYRVFEQLPYVRDQLVGLGVYGFSESGRRRFERFPDLVADDLFVQRLFAPAERLVVDAPFRVSAPRDLRGLLAARTRVARGNRELAARAGALQLDGAPTTSSTTRALVGLSRRPVLWPALLVYVAVTAQARRRAAAAPAGASWERDESSRTATPDRTDRVVVDGVALDPVTETTVVRQVMAESSAGRGGLIVTPNVDIHRQLRHGHDHLLDGVELVVADGMPLVWASRLQRQPLPERVTGASLVWSLAAAAAEEDRSVFLLGAEPEVAAEAATRLVQRQPGLRVVGRHSPPLGFETSPLEQQEIRTALRAAAPDLVLVALGFPKQERLMQDLRAEFPGTWFIGCGGSLDFIAGRTTRAPQWAQRSGLEWVFRLKQEPRRLFKRYLVHGVPHALGLTARSAVAGIRGRR